jgi:hypothetical protein
MLTSDDDESVNVGTYERVVLSAWAVFELSARVFE